MSHRSLSRRLLSAAVVLGAGALALTGCLPMPPAAPTAAPPSPTIDEPTTSSEPAAEPTESAEESAPPAASGDYAYTVDDGYGDTWSFSVTSIDDNPPMQSGTPEDGTFFTAIRIDGTHDEGSTPFHRCFDILVVGSDEQTYDFETTFATATAEDDIYEAGDTFEGARAVVQLPNGVDPVQIVLRSTYGYPDVADTILDVEQ